MGKGNSRIALKGRTSFKMTIRIRDVRAEDDSIKECTRLLLALVKLELLSRVFEHSFEERFARTTVRAIK